MNTLRTFREGISNGVRMRCEYVYAGTMNRTPTAACGFPNVSQRIAITLLTDCRNAANGLR